MKKMADMLLRRETFSEIVMGNTAIVRAMVEAGTRVVSSYPGSPTPEIASAIQSIPITKRPFYFEFSTNEKVATELAYGAAVNGHLSTVFFKSVGLNVAADTYVQLSLMNIIGGMVVVLGDDPGANSSQNEQDNRHYAMLSYTPVLEPADPTEVYQYYLEAARLSQKHYMPVILRLSTHVCHAKERVAFGEWNPVQPDDTPRFDPVNGPYIPITSLAIEQKRVALEKLRQVRDHAEQTKLNRIIDNDNPSRGVITMGLPFLSLMEIIDGAASAPDILKLAYAYPLAQETIVKFLLDHQEIKILEELDDTIEMQIKAIAFDHKLQVKIIGKTQSEDWIGEYTPDKVRQILSADWPDIITSHSKVKTIDPSPQRLPQMCPGCGHRSAFYAIKQALSSEDITVADIGCHTLGFLPPYEMGQLLMCMGSSTAIAAGLRLFNTSRKVVAFMGDSTFFHAALSGIVNAIFNQHAITLILMENGTTAMTGNQEHAATGKNFNGETDKIPVRQVLEGLGVKHIFEVDTYQQIKLTEMVIKAASIDEFSVVIARHTCMLKFIREQRKNPKYQQRHVVIDQKACERIHTCIESFGCPTFTRDVEGNITINTDLCIGDASCIQTCPTNAIRPAGKKIKGKAS